MRYYLHWLDAYRGIHTRPLRSLLTVLSIMLGVGALFTFLQLKNLAQYQIDQTLSALGPRVISAWWVPKDKHTQVITLKSMRQLDCTQHDLEIYPFAPTSHQALVHGHKVSGRVVALSYALIQRLHWPMTEGLLAVDSSRHPWVWVGHELAQKYSLRFADSVWIEGQAYKVAGVMKPLPLNPIFDFDVNYSFIVALEETQASWQRVEHALIYFPDTLPLHEVKESFKGMMAAAFGPTKLYFKDEALLSAHIRTSMLSYQTAFFWIAWVALTLAFVSLITQQWLSFLERKGECGMRLSLGATRLQLLSLFLSESLILGLIGTFLGLISGMLVLKVIANSLQWPYALDTFTTLWTVAGCLSMAAVGGAVPAWMAAMSHPTKLLAGP